MKVFSISAYFILFSMMISFQPVLGQSYDLQAKTPTDTLWPGDALTASEYILIPDTLGGYVLGTNSYHSIAIGQQFPVTTSYRIESALYWIGYKRVVADDSITFAIWTMDSLNGYTMAGDHQPGPGTILTRHATTMSQIDTSSSLSGACFITFEQPVIVIDDYVIGIDMSKVTNDSLGLYSTANGDGNGRELVWEQWQLNQTWHTLQASGWGFPALLDIDAMILPVVDLSQAGVNESPVINGLQCSFFPNPVRDNMHLNIHSAVAAEGRIMITDMAGRLACPEQTTALTPGSNSADLDLNILAPGQYLCLVIAGEARYAMKFVIE